MPIFGQVWLWSSLAFLLGALLCWGLVALPARRRVGELETQLAARARRQPRAEHPEQRRPVGAEHEDEFDPRRLLAGTPRDTELPEVQNEPLTRAYALSGTRSDVPAAPPPGISGALDGGHTTMSEASDTNTELSDGPGSSATQYLNVSGSSTLRPPPEESDRGWFDDDEKRDEKSDETRQQSADAPQTTVLPRVSEPEPIDARLVDDTTDTEDDPARDRPLDDPLDDGGTVFTQRTHPIPGELIRQLDESGGEPAPEPAHALVDEPADALVDDLADEDESAAEQTILTEPVALGESKHQLHDDPAVTSTLTPTAEPVAEPLETGPVHGAHDRTEVVPAHTAEEPTTVVSASRRPAASDEPSQQGAEEPENMPGVNVQAEPTKNKLPKRVPSKPPQRTPFGVQTTSPAAQPPPSEPATVENANDAPRSLFEPIVPAGDGSTVTSASSASPAPPVSSASPASPPKSESNGRGPFGPGSAMPLPGGAAPSPEYTIKASASAMRYCTPDSERFGRTVAEVWFRSAADAERVGFRPIS